MGAKIYTMASAKGGSGKTLLTASFATLINELKKKVLIIDFDSTTNGLTLMYLKEVLIEKELLLSKGSRPTGIFDSCDSKTLANIVVLNNGVSLAPASFYFDEYKGDDNLEEHNVSKIDNINKFGLFLNISKENYDYIFIDAQAGSDLYAGMAIRKHISDEVIIVSEYDPLSAAGVERLKGIFRDDLTYNRTWYLLNKMIPEFIKSFSDFLEIAKYLNPVPWDADVVKAYARRKLPLDFEQGNEFTLGLIRTLKTLTGEDLSSEITEWTNDRERIFRAPIETQYKEVYEEINKIDSKNNKNNKTISAFILIFFISAIAGGILLSLIKPLEDSAILLGLLTFATGMITYYFVKRSAYRKTGKSDYIRREILVERLNKLENLKYSNLDVIVKERNKI